MLNFECIRTMEPAQDTEWGEKSFGQIGHENRLDIHVLDTMGEIVCIKHFR